MNYKTLAWHETLELHELTVFKSVGLMKLKKGIKQVKDPQLRDIYQEGIDVLETSIRELLQFYRFAPKPGLTSEYREERVETGFYAGDLLAFTKSEVRNYAVAITETATPQLKDVLIKQLNQAIECHTRIYNYMYENGLYPSYDLNQLLQNDIQLAQRAINM